MTASPPSRSITRRAALAVTGAGAASIGLARVTPAATQEATPGPTAAHPVVGAWILATVRATPNTGYAVFHADGTYMEVNPDTGTGMGVWQATGERSGELINKWPNINTEGATYVPGTSTLRVTFTVDADGMAYTGEYHLDLTAPDGATLASSEGEFIATRLTLETPSSATPEAATPAT
jgi:hypothetical protein